MTYVYLLSDYGEHGSENVTATLDRSKLEQMIDDHWAITEEEHLGRNSEAIKAWLEEANGGLRELLQKPDDELAADGDGWNLTTGWGGIQLHVVKLV